MPRALRWSYRGGAVSYERGTPVLSQIDRDPTFALRRSTLDFCLGGQRSCNKDPERQSRQRDFFIHKLLVRIHLIIVMICWTGLAP